MKLRRAAPAVALLATVFTAQAQTLISEGFSDVTGLVGWAQVDTSAPAASPWFQGNAAIFAAQAGAPNAYVAANPLTASGALVTAVSNYLITPVFSLEMPTELSFWVRSPGLTSGFPDNLQVLLSTSGASTAVASFSSLLADFNSAIPNVWTQRTITVAGQGAGSSGRIAFRYVVPNTEVGGDYLGIDTVNIAAIPEPSTVASLLLGLGALGVAVGRRKVREKG